MFRVFLTASTVKAQVCGDTCPQTHCIEQICQRCLDYNRSCPPWIQGRWSGLHLRQDGTTQPSAPWEMEIVGYNFTLSGQGVTGLRGRAYCNLIERGSSGGGASAYDIDLIYDEPSGYKGSASPSVVQLYTTGLMENTMQLQIMLPFRFVPYEADECDTPRTPSSEFAAPIPLTYWVVRYLCTTPQLTVRCPHWYDGKWAASVWIPKGGIGGNFLKSEQLLSISGTVLQMTSRNNLTDKTLRSTNYALKCTPSTESGNNLEVALHVDLSTTDSSPSHILRGASLFSSFPGRFDLSLAQPNWCQRPYNTKNAFIYPVSFTPPHVTSTFICVEPIMKDLCSIFLLGKWRGESALQQDIGDMNSHTWNTTRKHANSSSSKFWVESEFNGRGWTELSNISCSLSSEFPSLVILDIYHAAVASSTEMNSTAVMVSGWITHALVRFGSTYADIEIVLGDPGKCNRPTATDLTSPSGGFTSFRMTCAIKPLNDTCPQWLYGIRNTATFDYLSGMNVYVGESSFEMKMSIPNNNSTTGSITCGSLFGKTSSESSSVAIDINIRSPSFLSGWIQRGWATYLSDVGAVQLHISSPGVCLRPKPNMLDGSNLYKLHPNNKDHIRTSIYGCSTPPLVGACPRWLDGSWNAVTSAGSSFTTYLPEWMDPSIEPLNLTIVGSRAQIGVAGGNVVLHWVTCGTDYDGTVTVDFRPDSQSFLAGRILRALVNFNDETGILKIALANYGWCSRPEFLHNTAPFHVNEYSCTTALVGTTCPRWLDGHWDIFQELSSTLLFEWKVKSNVSSITVDGNGGQFSPDTIPSVKISGLIAVYCGTSISSSLQVDMEIDLTYISRYSNLTVVERGWLRRTSVLPRSSAYIIRSPPNWCYRHAPASSSVRFDTVNCTTDTLEHRCPGWLRGTWKFHDTDMMSNNVVSMGQHNILPLSFQSRKWVVSNTVRYVTIQDLEGTRLASLNCSNISVTLDGKNFLYMDVFYISDDATVPLWKKRMDHFLVALDTSNQDTKTVSLVEAPAGWCSRPPVNIKTVTGLDNLFKRSTAVQVESPRVLSLFSVLPVWETLKIGVSVATSTLKFIWDETVDDRNSPVHQYLLMWDVEPQKAVCDIGYAGGVFGACCDSDHDCSSNVCDTVNRVCTYICNEDSECPNYEKHESHEPLCKDSSITHSYDDPLPLRKWCDASQLTSFGVRFCGNFCLRNSSIQTASLLEDILRDSTCEDSARATCLAQRYQMRSCHNATIRKALGLSGYKRYEHFNDNSTISKFVVGLRYFSKIYAANEVGFGWPTDSIPSSEIARAAPPPPSLLTVTQVEAATLNASGMTLEDAKTSIKVTFMQPTFDNGASIETYFVEWHVHPSFVEISSHYQNNARAVMSCNVGAGTFAAGNGEVYSLLYGQNSCGKHCLNNKTKTACSDYPSCPFMDKNLSNSLCNELSLLNFGFNSSSIISYEKKLSESEEQQRQHQCNLKIQEIETLLQSSYCNILRSQMDLASVLPDQAFGESLPLCSVGTCSGDLWNKINLMSSNNCSRVREIVNHTQINRLWAYLDVKCSINSDKTSSCSEEIPELIRQIDNRTLSCKTLRMFGSCVSKIAEFWKNVESTTNISIVRHYGKTVGMLHDQSTVRGRLSKPQYGHILEKINSFCPEFARDVCPHNNVSSACKNVREHCLCDSPLDPGCSHPHVTRRLNTAQTVNRMIITASLEPQYSVVVSNILPRTPYYVRVGASNEIGGSMYRTTSKPVAALVIAEKPINVFVALLNNITNKSTRAALSTSVFLGFRTAAIDWNWVTHYRIDVSTVKSFNDTTKMREIFLDQPALNPFESGIVNMTVDQLTPGVRYYFQVSAYITTYGRPQLATPNSIVPPLQVPDPPRNFTVYPVNGSILAVNWSIPFFNGGRPLLAHQLEWSQHKNFSCSMEVKHPSICGEKYIHLPTVLDENSTEKIAKIEFDASLTTRIEGVLMGTFYYVRASSCNDLGCGVLANHIPVKPMQPPSVPLQVNVDVHNHSALIVRFAAPESTGGDSVDYYKVKWNIPSRDISAEKIILPTKDLFQNITAPTLPPWTGCNCTSTLPYPSSRGKCCCSNQDCEDEMVCHPEIRSCTSPCNGNVSTTCSPVFLNNFSRKNLPLLSAMPDISLPMTCNRSSVVRKYCEALCPFNQSNPFSPCVFTSNPIAFDQSACHPSDFEGGWVLSSVKGGIGNKPSTFCATYIKRYCSVISKNDPACSLLAIQHVLRNIPSCPQRQPKQVTEGMFAFVVVQALATNSDKNGTNYGNGVPHQLGISACNAAGCSNLAMFEKLVTPAARLLLSEIRQCTAEGRNNDKYFVSLNSKPTSNVEIIIQGGFGQLKPRENKHIFFSVSDWYEKKEISVSAVDDNYDEGKSTFLIMKHSIVTADDKIAKSIEYVPSNFVNVTIFDNDYADIAISQTSLVLAEGFAGKEVFYQLTARPYYEVRLILIGTTSTSVSQQMIIFSPNITNWNARHRIVFMAVDDHVDEINLEVEYVKWNLLTTDQVYMNTNVPILSTVVIDDDFASLNLEYSSIQLNEGKAAVSYRVSITSQPTSEVAIIISVGTAVSCVFNKTSSRLENDCNHMKERSTDVWVTSNGKVAVDEAVIYFSPSTWNVSQFFMIAAREDFMDMGDSFNMTLQHTSISEDNKYNRASDVTVPLSLQIKDNDEAILTMSRWDVVVTEDGLYEDEYTILFETMPTAISCITASLEGFDHVSIIPSQMCFGESNWSLPQAFHLSATLPLPGARSSEGALVGWITHELTTNAVEYSNKKLEDVEITIVEKKSDLDLTDAPIYHSVAFSDVAHEIVVKFKGAAYVLQFGMKSKTSCVIYFIERVLLKMGESPQCYWSDKFTLHAILGKGWTITSTQKVTLRSGAVRTTASSIITSGGYKLLQERKPAPTLREIYFSESGGAIMIRFESLNGCWEGLKDDASTTKCSQVFHNADLLLGKNAECTWVKSCLLQVILGFAATIRATRDVSACGTCECNSCVPRAAYEQAGSFDELCKSPSHQCADPQCYCKDKSTTNLCPDGLSLKLMKGAVKAIQFGLLSSEGCMHVKFPEKIFVPNSIITAPRHFPVCSPLVVSGTDSETSGGGRDQFRWRVTAFDVDGGGIKVVPAAVQAVIRQANIVNADMLQFPANVFEFESRYRFSLVITNFLTMSIQAPNNETGGNSDTDINYFKGIESKQLDYHDITASYVPLPQLAILGPTKTVVKSRDRVVIRAKAFAAACATDKSLVYSWYQVQGDLDWNIVKKSQKGNDDMTLPVLVIPPNMLTKGRDYIFRVSVYARSTPTLTNYENVLLSVTSGVIVAGLDSYFRTCGEDDPLSINAIDHSYHQDDASAELQYFWNCIYIKGGDNRPCKAMKYSSGLFSGMLTLPRNTFAAGDEILFTVDVNLAVDKSDYSSANMTVIILPGMTPVVQIHQGPQMIINPEEKLSLSGEVQWPPGEMTGNYFWNETSGSLDLLAETQNVYYSARDRLHLVVRPNLLVPGREYTFVLTAIGKKTNGSASVFVRINRPPRGGFFQVTPAIGNGLQTEFTFSVGSWADDETNYPLYYSFYISQVSDDDQGEKSATKKVFPLSVDKIQNSRQVFRLPTGKKENGYNLYPTARICDSLGACATCSSGFDGKKVVLNVKPLSSPVDASKVLNNIVDSKYASIEDTAIVGIAAVMMYPEECLSPKSQYTSSCESALESRRTDVENMFNLLVASEAITLPSKIALEQQSLTLAEISVFADKKPSSFVYNLIEHGNRIIDSAFSSGICLSPTSIVGLHSVFESLVDAATHNLSHVNKSWSVGQKVSSAIERAMSNALLNHAVGEDPIVVSGEKLSTYGKVETLSQIPWVPLELLKGDFGDIGFSMPNSIRGINSISTPLQFVAVAQSENNNPGRSLNRIVTDLNVYDTKANRIQIGNLTQPIGLSLPALESLDNTLNSYSEMRCYFWDSGTSKWSQNGLFVQRTQNKNNTAVSTVGCATTHLTSFVLETNQYKLPFYEKNRADNITANHAQLIFIFDTSNIPVSGIIFGMSIMYVLMIVCINVYEKQTSNKEFAKSSMERFLNTGSTAWTPSDMVDKRSTSNLLKSYLATLTHQHPLFGWLRPPSQLGMPRLCYVLVLWNTTSIIFFTSSASIGGSNLYETENLPLGWFYALCGLIMSSTLQSIVSSSLVWKSTQLIEGGGRCFYCYFFCCCRCFRSEKNFSIIQSRKRIQISKLPKHLWVDFERLRRRCIAYVDYRNVSTTRDGDAVVDNNARASNKNSYERYVVETAQLQGYPYPRSVYESIVALQAVWRTYVVKTNLRAFLNKKKSSNNRNEKYVFLDYDDDNDDESFETKKNNKRSRKSNQKLQKIHKNHGIRKNKIYNSNNIVSNKKENSSTEPSKMGEIIKNRLSLKLRQIALVLQTLAVTSGFILILVGFSELFDNLHRQYAQATVGLGFFLIATTSLGSFSLKYCNGLHLVIYVATNILSCLISSVLLFLVSSAGSEDVTTLEVVRSEWEGLYSLSATSLTAQQQLIQWQNTYSCCGVQDLQDHNIMAVQPCSLNISSGCESHLANHIKSKLNYVQFALGLCMFIQILACLVCLAMSTKFNFRGFEEKLVIKLMENHSAQMAQAFSNGKSPSDLATSKLFTGLTLLTTFKAANIIQNSARVYLARRRCYRKMEYDRINGIETKNMQFVLYFTIVTALIISAAGLDVLAVALALKFDDIRTIRWRQSMELSFAILFGFLLPCTSVMTLVLDPRWNSWLKVKFRVWHEAN